MKTCSRCKLSKPPDQFYPCVNTKDNLQYKCKQCDRENRLKNRLRLNELSKKRRQEFPERQRRYDLLANYGITLEEFNTKKTEQDGACAICGIVPKTGNLSVDHNHTTGKIRGLLCSNCNAGLGFFKEARERLLKAINYLEKI